MRREHLRCQLEADLVVAAPGGPVRHHLDAALLYMGQHAGHGHVPGDAGGVPIAPLVAGLSLDELDAGLANSRSAVVEDHLSGPTSLHPALYVFDAFLVGLAQIGGIGDDL